MKLLMPFVKFGRGIAHVIGLMRYNTDVRDIYGPNPNVSDAERLLASGVASNVITTSGGGW